MVILNRLILSMLTVLVTFIVTNSHACDSANLPAGATLKCLPANPNQTSTSNGNILPRFQLLTTIEEVPATDLDVQTVLQNESVMSHGILLRFAELSTGDIHYFKTVRTRSDEPEPEIIIEFRAQSRNNPDTLITARVKWGMQVYGPTEQLKDQIAAYDKFILERDNR